jgi:hypothetical protein
MCWLIFDLYIYFEIIYVTLEQLVPSEKFSDIPVNAFEIDVSSCQFLFDVFMYIVLSTFGNVITDFMVYIKLRSCTSFEPFEISTRVFVIFLFL